MLAIKDKTPRQLRKEELTGPYFHVKQQQMMPTVTGIPQAK
jgi:hypothetical protein